MDNKTQYTPGPWRVGESGPKTTDIKSGHNCLIARVIQDGLPEANARLIAAAPETAAERDRLREINAVMLAALQEAQMALFHGAPVTVGLENQINAAIAKAEGQ